MPKLSFPKRVTKITNFAKNHVWGLGIGDWKLGVETLNRSGSVSLPRGIIAQHLVTSRCYLVELSRSISSRPPLLLGGIIAQRLVSSLPRGIIAQRAVASLLGGIIAQHLVASLLGGIIAQRAVASQIIALCLASYSQAASEQDARTTKGRIIPN